MLKNKDKLIFVYNAEWREFLDTLLFEKEFLRRDEFQKRYPELEKIDMDKNTHKYEQ